MMVAGAEAAILLKRLAIRVSAYFAGRAAELMSKAVAVAVAVQSAQLNADVAKSELQTPVRAC